MVSVRMVLAIFPFDWLASWSLSECLSVRHAARGSRRKILSAISSCGILHEHCTLIMLPLIGPDIRIRFWQQG